MIAKDSSSAVQGPSIPYPNGNGNEWRVTICEELMVDVKMMTQQSIEIITGDASVTVSIVQLGVPETHSFSGARYKNQVSGEDSLDDARMITTFGAVNLLVEETATDSAMECQVFELELPEENQPAFQRSTSMKTTVAKDENSRNEDFEIRREDAKDTGAERPKQPSSHVDQFRRSRDNLRMPIVITAARSATGRQCLQAFRGRAPAVLKPLQENCRKKKRLGDTETFHTRKRYIKDARYGSRRSGSSFKLFEVKEKMKKPKWKDQRNTAKPRRDPRRLSPIEAISCFETWIEDVTVGAVVDL